MKNNLFYYPLVLLLVITSCLDSKKRITVPFVRYCNPDDVTGLDFGRIAYGKIKMIKEEHFVTNTEIKFGETKKIKKLTDSEIFLFNKKNQLVKYNNQSNDSAKMFYKDKLLILKKHWSTLNTKIGDFNSLDYTVKYYYSKNRKRRKAIKNYFDANGNMSKSYFLNGSSHEGSDYVTISFFNDNNFLMKDDIYYPDGTFYYSIEYSVDHAGNLLYECKDQNRIECFKSFLGGNKYDENNNIIEYGRYYSNFDKNKNWLKFKVIDNSNTIYETVRKIEYY